MVNLKQIKSTHYMHTLNMSIYGLRIIKLLISCLTNINLHEIG